MTLDTPDVPERRQSPRYEIELAIDLVLANGSILSVTTRNISSCGIQIICETWVTEQIEPRGIQSYSVGQIRIKAVTELPVGDKTKKLYANCRILSVQRMSQDEYMLNLSFLGFENGSEKFLDMFLDQYQQKKTVINVSAAISA